MKLRILQLLGKIVFKLQSMEPVSITPILHQCSNGSYTRCFQVGKIVILSFNINITTATVSYDYISGLPLPIEGGWACSGVQTGTTNVMRLWITPQGTLRTDGNAYTGWCSGNITYVCQ